MAVADVDVASRRAGKRVWKCILFSPGSCLLVKISTSERDTATRSSIDPSALFVRFSVILPCSGLFL